MTATPEAGEKPSAPTPTVSVVGDTVPGTPKRRTLADLVLGRRLASAEEGEQKIGPLAGIPVLGLDALSSAAYGPEAALTLLLPLGVLGLVRGMQITALIVLVLLDRLLLVPPDHRRLPERRRLLHGREGQPRPDVGAPRGRRARPRLRPERRGRHLGGRGRARLGDPLAAPVHPPALSRDPGHPHAGEPPGHARVGPRRSSCRPTSSSRRW